jgi:hypothetical protein
LEFESARSSIVKSIKQRDLLNTWLRPYARVQATPSLAEYEPERLLLPFSDRTEVTRIIASLKTISEDGGFEIKNLMCGLDTLPAPKLRCVIDRDLFHRAPGRISSGDLIGFA